MKNTDIAQLKQIVANWASRLPYKTRIYAFGSWVKGTAKPDSDLDIALEFLELEEDIPWRLWMTIHEKLQSDLSREIGLKVDLQLYEGDESPTIKESLATTSIILYSSEEL